MKIKYKLLIITTVSVVTTIVLGIFLYVFVSSLDSSMQKNNISIQMIKKIFDRRVFLDDYLSNHLDRSKDQWLIAHDSLVDYVQSQSAKFVDENSKVLIGEMNQIFNKNRQMFLQLVSIHDSNSKKVTTLVDQNQEVHMAGQLLVMSQSLILLSDQLSVLSQQDAARAYKNIVLILIFFIIGLFLFTSIVIFFLWKSIVYPIAELRRGAEIIGEGNWEYKVSIKSKDEIGDLSRAFDQMTEKLKDRTVKLDALNQQLRASNEQIYASNHQLTATEKGLKEKINDLEMFNKATIGRELKMIELKKEIEELKRAKNS